MMKNGTRARLVDGGFGRNYTRPFRQKRGSRQPVENSGRENTFEGQAETGTYMARVRILKTRLKKK